MNTLRIASLDASPHMLKALSQLTSAAFAGEISAQDLTADAPVMRGLSGVIIGPAAGNAAAHTIAALSAGLHVMCEALPGPDVEDMIAIRKAEANSGGRLLHYAHGLHHHASVTEALAQIAADTFGPIRTVRAVYGCPAPHPQGVLFERGLPVMDLLHRLCGMFVDVTAMLEGQDGKAETNAVCQMRTYDGVIASLHVSATQWRETFRIEIGCEAGSIWLDGLTGQGGVFGPEMLITRAAMTGADETIQRFDTETNTNGHMAAFLGAMAGGPRDSSATSQAAFDAVSMIRRLYAADPTFVPHAPDAAHPEHPHIPPFGAAS